MSALSERQSNREGASDPRLAVQRHGAPVCDGDLSDHRQPDTRAPDVSGEGSAATDEFLKDCALFGMRNTRPMIDHRDRGVFPVLSTLDVNRRRAGSVFDRILDQISDRDRNGMFVPENPQPRRAQDVSSRLPDECPSAPASSATV